MPNDDNLKRPISGGDIKKLWRLRFFLRPIMFIIIAGAVLGIFAAVASVLLPYASKIAIDNYIIPVGPKVKLSAGAPIPPALDSAIASGKYIESGSEGIIFLKPEAAKLINRADEKKLLDSGFLSRERYYAKPLDKDDEMSLLAEQHGDIFEKYPHALAVEEKNLSSIPEALTLIWRSSDLSGLARLALIFAFLMLAAYAFEFGQRVVLEIGAQRFALNLRQKILEHLFSLSQSFFDRSQSARLSSRLTNDVNNLSNLCKTTVATVFNDLISLSIITIILFSLNTKLALITLIFTPLTLILSIYFGRLSRLVQRELRARLAIINQIFAEALGGIDIIQAFRQEERNIDNFKKLNYENYLSSIRQMKIHAVFVPMLDFFASIIMALLIWYGGADVLAGTVSLGVIAAFIAYARRFFHPIQDLAEKMNIFQSAFASLERLIDLLDENEQIEEIDKPLAPVKNGGAMEFRQVSFKYLDDGPLVLKDISLKVNKGESVAIVGQTGSGKSSIINLIQRNYDPQEGEIYFDNIPLKDLNLNAHRSRLGLVTQDVYLYAGTIMENLRLGRQELSDREIISATEAIGADKFIRNLPNGFDEKLGPGGRQLSAGERQLLACARALIKTPEIIILDEATASVDAESEKLVEQALYTLFQGRTSIIIAHRLATIRRVDKIFVLHEGCIIENGSQEELIERKGAYYKLALLQGLVT